MEKPYMIRKTVYKNGISYKLNNRRVTVIEEENGAIQVHFYIVDENPNPSALCERIRGKVSKTAIRLTREGAKVLAAALIELLNAKENQ